MIWNTNHVPFQIISTMKWPWCGYRPPHFQQLFQLWHVNALTGQCGKREYGSKKGNANGPTNEYGGFNGDEPTEKWILWEYTCVYIYIHMLICNQIDRSCWVPNRHKVRMDNFASFSARFSFGLPERKWSGLNSIDKIYIHWFILHGVYGLRV